MSGYEGARHIARALFDRPVYPDAVCLGAYAVGKRNPWYPSGHAGEQEADVAEAKRLCATCPHQDECAEWAIAHPNECGIWGGLDEAQRGTIRRYRREGRGVDLAATRARWFHAEAERIARRRNAGRAANPGQPVEHGTVRGYRYERKRDLPICEPCRAAIAAHRREKRRAAKGKPITVPTPLDRCGTTAGERAHRRLGEQPCDACREAANAAKREWRERRLTVVPDEATG